MGYIIYQELNKGLKSMGDRYIRKPVVFNSESSWHMELLNQINKESNNFSGYVLSILKSHFDSKRVVAIKNEPLRGARIVLNGKEINK